MVPNDVYSSLLFSQVLPNTKHWNFCDLVLWTPRAILPLLCRVGVLGDGDSLASYGDIFALTLEFAQRVTKE